MEHLLLGANAQWSKCSILQNIFKSNQATGLDPGLDKQIFSVLLQIFSYPSLLTYVLGAQKNHLIETVLLSTHNICFG